MNVLLYLGAALITVVAALCALLYIRVSAMQSQFKTQREQLDRIEVSIHLLADLHEGMQKRVEQLATDVLHREIYQNADDRHEHAIQDAKAGCDVALLVQRHGLSSDEAALIQALHGRHRESVPAEPEPPHAELQSWTGEV